MPSIHVFFYLLISMCGLIIYKLSVEGLTTLP